MLTYICFNNELIFVILNLHYLNLIWKCLTIILIEIQRLISNIPYNLTSTILIKQIIYNVNINVPF